MIRIFVAYPLKQEFSEQVNELSLKNQDENIRWTYLENLHLTLFFIGEIEEKNLALVEESLSEVFSNQKKFIVEFDDITLKGKQSKPSMIWARFKNSLMFSELFHSIYSAVKNYMTIKVVHDDPIPHCTLARIRKGTDLLEYDLSIKVLPPSVIEIHKAELWQTIQNKEGVRYIRLAEFPLN